MSKTFSVEKDAKLAALRQADTFPHETGPIEVHETHMSWVFLTRAHVYKMKKAVKYPFLDFSSLKKRKVNCDREVRLNKRLAPGVYQGTVALVLTPEGKLKVESQGKPVEWLVKMRRLPRERMLDRMATEGVLPDEPIRETGRILARFYTERQPVKFSAEEYLLRIRQNVDANAAELGNPDYELDEEHLASVDHWQRTVLEKEPDLLADRARNSRIVEGHGDLRPEHICLLHSPVIFDCLEFNRDLRILDPVEELAHLAMECEFLHSTRPGEILFQVYSKETNDHPPGRLITFYKIYRATLRARLAVLHRKDSHHDHWPTWQRKARDYLLLADRYMKRD